jgi:hypothetical protein
MAISKLLKDKIETRLASWDAEIEAAEAKAKARQAEARAEAADAELDEEFWTRVKDLKARAAQSREYLAELADAGEEQAGKLTQKIRDLLA